MMKRHMCVRARNGMRRNRLRRKRFFRRILGRSARAETKRVLSMRKKAEVYNTELGLFRREHPPPFASKCTRAFVFQGEYEDYLRHPLPDLSNVDHLRAFYKSQYGVDY